MERPVGSFLFYFFLSVACTLSMNGGRPLFYLFFFFVENFCPFSPPVNSIFYSDLDIRLFPLFMHAVIFPFLFFFVADGHGARMDQKGGCFHPSCNIEVSIEDGAGRCVCVSCMSGPSIEFVSRLHYDIAHADPVGWILELCIG
ncbi:hypothetical protein BJX96DRAFT_14840, partial [Aspergillus floccosus]